MRMAQEADHGSAPAQAKTEYDRMLGVVRQSKDDLVAVGYEEFAVESFYEVYLHSSYFEVVVLCLSVHRAFLCSRS
jgi:hypothetical protein